MPQSLPRRVKTQAQIFSAFVTAFGKTLISGHVPEAAPEEAPLVAPGAMRVWAQNVALFLDDAVVLKLRDFVADLVMNDPEEPLVPEDKNSYVFAIRAGSIRIPAPSMEALLNRYVLPAAGAPIKDARLAISGDRLILRGKVHRFRLDLPITLESQVSIGPDGMIELLPEHIAVSEFGVGGMFKLLKLELERLVDLPAEGPFRVFGNRITIDPIEIFPAPKAIGRPSAVRIERGELVLEYGSDRAIEPPPLVEPGTPNYMLCVGHDLVVGRMLMHDAYFQIINQEPASHLDFSLERYRDQLARGSSSLRHGDHLLVRLPNLNGPVATANGSH